jgi:glycosyltransferase involved in cell wall biosynthesis
VTRPNGQESPKEFIALLGRRDEPTDGVRDYCGWLGRALEERGSSLVEAEVAWAKLGWGRALAELWRQASAWRGRWVLVQYTALGWSSRGFPLGVLAALRVLRRRGARIAIVFHSAEPQAPYREGTGQAARRSIDRLRRACQCWVMRRASRQAARIILPVPPERTSWLGGRGDRAKAAFIPIGANIPADLAGADASAQAEVPVLPKTGDRAAGRVDPSAQAGSRQRGRDANEAAPVLPTVAVFGVTEAPHAAREVEEIACAARRAKQRLPRLRLVVFGRGSAEARPLLERALDGSGIELEVLGILPAAEVARELAQADAFVFVRGELAANRSSAIAAVACGLPIVGYGTPNASFPLSRAGARLVPSGRREELGEALAEILTDPSLRQQMRERSRQALADYFSWERIAERYLEALGGE